MRARSPRLMLAGLMLAAVALGGCRQAPAPRLPESVWIPSAGASFTTLERDTHFSRVPARGRDLLIHEERDGNGWLTWIVSLPDTPKLNEPLEVGPDSRDAVRAWIMEQVPGLPTHASPADGRLIVHAKEADAVHATVDLSAESAPPHAGSDFGPRVRLTRKLEWVRAGVDSTQPQELKTRGGESATPSP